jgi:IS4 transposase
VVSFEQGGHRYQGRVIAQSLTPQAAERARARVRRRASKKQYAVQEDTVFFAGWLIVLTSLPKREWSLAPVLGLYRARWQIELVIKRMKQVLKLAQLQACWPRLRRFVCSRRLRRLQQEGTIR